MRCVPFNLPLAVISNQIKPREAGGLDRIRKIATSWVPDGSSMCQPTAVAFPQGSRRTESEIKSDQGGTWLATLDCGDWHRTTQLPNVPSYTRKLQEFGSVCHGRALTALGPLVLPSCAGAAGAAGAMDGDTEGAELPEAGGGKRHSFCQVSPSQSAAKSG